MDETTDNRLAERLIRGEPGAFREFVETYKKRVYGLAFELTRNHADAEDVSQTVFIKIFQSMETFREGGNLNAWLYRISVNAAIDHLRKRSFFPADRAAELPERRGEDPGRAAERSLLQLKIDAALSRISEREKTVFILRHYHDLSLKEIAEALGLTVGAVKSYLFRSIKKLQRELGVAPTPLEPGG
jgi:RNA polymerase sigma-70 factor (ECF subfamily)